MRLADIIIPVGAENTVAINLVARNINFHLFKEFTSLKLQPLGFNYEISPKDIIDPCHQFFGENIIINENESHIYTLKMIFEDFINGTKIKFYPMFLDLILNNLLSIFHNKNKPLNKSEFIYLTEHENIEDINTNKINSVKNIIYFKPIFLSEDAMDMLE
jgi:hypothetical protein